jgi:hypothetical protein
VCVCVCVCVRGKDAWQQSIINNRCIRCSLQDLLSYCILYTLGAVSCSGSGRGRCRLSLHIYAYLLINYLHNKQQFAHKANTFGDKKKDGHC